MPQEDYEDACEALGSYFLGNQIMKSSSSSHETKMRSVAQTHGNVLEVQGVPGGNSALKSVFCHSTGRGFLGHKCKLQAFLGPFLFLWLCSHTSYIRYVGEYICEQSCPDPFVELLSMCSSKLFLTMLMPFYPDPCSSKLQKSLLAW